jgi:hypothetical protein
MLTALREHGGPTEFLMLAGDSKRLGMATQSRGHGTQHTAISG